MAVPVGRAGAWGRRRSILRRLLGTVVLASPLSVTVGERAGAVADVTVTFPTVGEQTWTVPRGVTSAQFVVSGAQGGDALEAGGGLGATVEAVVSVTEGQQVDLVVAGRGGGFGGVGGIGGGGDGAGHPPNPNFASGGGGGASQVTIAGAAVIVAGGGGGAATRVRRRGERSGGEWLQLRWIRLRRRGG